MSNVKLGLLWVFGLIVVLALGWVFMGNDLAMYKFFAPRREAVRRQVYEQTKSYNQGMIQNLRQMQAQYIIATPVQQGGLRSVILHQYADYPDDQLPPDLRAFMNKLKDQP